MKILGRASVHDFLGDFVVYRNLVPFDDRLAEMQDRAPRRTPRKLDPAYAEAMIALLNRARSLEQKTTTLQRLVYIGDTQLGDGRAFRNLCELSGWQGMAFIADEKLGDPASFHLEERGGSTLCIANRWKALELFVDELRARNFAIDERTVVVIDLDKTAFGARGRNDRVIDQVRKLAVKETVAKLVGATFNEATFTHAYDQLNQSTYHSLTEDNQDYLAYICLIIESGFRDVSSLIEAYQQGIMTGFKDFLQEVEVHLDGLPATLAEIHHDVHDAVQRGDPTPFKSFRRMEYLVTAERMKPVEGTDSVDRVLQENIVITSEVLECARRCAQAGALMFGLSDKPDEASIPSPEQRALGHVPIHHIRMHVVGAVA